MPDGLERTPYPSNGNGKPKRGRGRPKGSKNPNGGRPKGSKGKAVIVRQEVVEQCKALVGQRAEGLTTRVLDEESRLAFSDIASLFHQDSWELIPPSELPQDVRASISSIQIVRRTIPRGELEPIEETTYKYSFWDKGRSLERLSKHLGLYEQDNAQKKSAPPQINLYLEQGGAQVAILPGPGANGYNED